MVGDDILFPQIQLDGKKKVQFDVNDERAKFFESSDVIRRYTAKFHVYEIPTAFDSNSVVGPSQQHGTL